MADGDGHSFNKNWSAGFQRLRVETTILSIVLLAITQSSLELTRVPLLGFEADEPLPRAPLTMLLFAFWGYTLTAWIMRFFVEWREVSRPREVMQNLLSSMGELSEKIRLSTAPDATPFLRDAEEILDRLSQFETESVAWHQQFLSNFKNQQLKVGELFSSFGANYPRSDAEGRQWIAQAESAASRQIHRMLGQIDQSVRASELAISELVDRMDYIRQSLEATRVQISSELTEKGPRVVDALNAMQRQVAIARVQAFSLNGAVFADRLILAFWLPLLFCMCAFLWSVPQGWKDMGLSWSTPANCWNDSCWLRD